MNEINNFNNVYSKSIYSKSSNTIEAQPPPVSGDFLLLDGTDFLLLDDTNFELL